MTMQTKTIGRMPTDHGPYVEGQSYGKKFQTKLFGCVWESKHDNNSTAPATLNAQAGTITPNTTDWKKVTGSTDQWLIDNGYKNTPASHVTDTNQNNKTQQQINTEVKTEIGTDSTPGSVKGRVKSLENSVGTGGSVDQRIAAVVGDATLAGNTLEKLEDRLSPVETAVGSGGSVDSRISTAVGAESTRAQAAEQDLRDAYAAIMGQSGIQMVIGTLPASGVEKTIYRQPDPENDPPQFYADFMWNGTQFVMMAKYDNAIDDEPTAGSPNLVKSGGVADEFSQVNNFLLSEYFGKYVGNFNTGALTSATESSNGYLIKVLPNKSYSFNTPSFLKYGGASVQCYSDFPSFSTATTLNLGLAPVSGRTFKTLPNTKYVVISVATASDDKNNRVESVSTDLGELEKTVYDFISKTNAEIYDIVSANVNLLTNFAGIYCGNFNTGNVSQADNTHDGYLIPVKEGQYFFNINNLLYDVYTSFACYSGTPSTSTFLGRATYQYSGEYNTIKVLPGTKYLLISVNPSNATGNEQFFFLNSLLKDLIARNRIICYGDSLTYGSSQTPGVSYPAKLQELLGSDWKVVNTGVGGIGSLFIMAVQGCAQIKLIGSNADGSLTIPADGTEVDFEGIRIQRSDNSYIDYSVPNNNVLFGMLNSLKIDPFFGLYFSIGYNTGTDKPTIKKVSGTMASPVNTVPYPNVYTYNQRNPYNTNNVAIFWMGTNGAWSNSEELTEQYKKMIRYNGTRKYLVIGLTDSRISLERRQSLEKCLLNEFGTQFINIREYLVNYGLSDAGITPTSADTEAIANGNVPPSLLVSDGIHFNDTGYNLIGTYIYKRLINLYFV